MTNAPTSTEGWTWRQLVHHWVEISGGWSALADQMIQRANGLVEISLDMQTVEKGLRRLANKSHEDGGQYGRWLLRFFGMPADVERWIERLGQYHHRFADLPSSLRASQLALWDRPPMNQSPCAIWLILARASLAHRASDTQTLTHLMQQAEHLASRASSKAQLEYGLFLARHLMDTQGPAQAQRQLESLRPLLDALTEERLVYQARWWDQWIYVSRRRQLPIHQARLLYEAIEGEEHHPYIGFVRALGMAYCCWKVGQVDDATTHALHALDHAGDGGFVRLRVVALNLLSHIHGDGHGPYHERARRLARALDDEELLSRLAKPRQQSPSS